MPSTKPIKICCAFIICIFMACSNDTTSSSSLTGDSTSKQIWDTLNNQSPAVTKNCYELPAISNETFSQFQTEFYRVVTTDDVDENSAQMIRSYKPIIDGLGIAYDNINVIAECGMPYNVIDSKLTKVDFITIIGATDDWAFRKCDYDDPKTNSFPYSKEFVIQSGPYRDDHTDHHLSVIDTGTKKLYEIYQLRECSNGWLHQGAAMFDLTSKNPRVSYFHGSADAAGLPILPLLIRWDEVQSGSINHALRITLFNTKSSYVFPATHWAVNSRGTVAIPMGARLRLRKSFPETGCSKELKVILQCLKTYGAIVADNGTHFALTAAADCRFSSFSHYDPDPKTPSFWLSDSTYTQVVKPEDFEILKIKNPLHDQDEKCDQAHINNQAISCADEHNINKYNNLKVTGH